MENNNEQLNPTTVRLTEKAQVIKEDLAPIFGLKNILSAGLILFGKLTDTEQKITINEANSSLEDAPLPKPEIEFRRRVLAIVKEAQAIPAKKKLARRANPSKSA